MEQATHEGSRGGSPDWPRALALFGVVLVTSIFVHPGVVIGVPLALLIALTGLGNVVSAAVVGLVILILAAGRDPLGDGLWYTERAWAVLLGGWFVAMTLLVPRWRLTSRALGAVAGAAAVAAAIFGIRGGSWGALDAAVERLLQTQANGTVAWWRSVGGPEGISTEMTDIAQGLAAAQTAVFPALLGIESLAALGVAWWARGRLLGRPEIGLAPMREFRFNDHLVWILVLGLMLVLAGSGTGLSRVGTNAVFFMGTLYALRGLAVFLFVSGGVSVLGAVLFVVLMTVVPVVILGTAALIGIGDTWLDLRARSAELAG